MFWNSCLQTGRSWRASFWWRCRPPGRLRRTGFAAAGALFAGYIIPDVQPFQVTMVPTYLVLNSWGFWTPTWR